MTESDSRTRYTRETRTYFDYNAKTLIIEAIKENRRPFTVGNRIEQIKMQLTSLWGNIK